MTYKAEHAVPSAIHRQFASLAAVLEGVDRQFGVLVHNLDEFKSNFGAYHEPAEVEAEIARLRIVLSYDSNNPDLAVKIAQLALSIGQHETALEILRPYAAEAHQGVERVRGTALLEMHWDDPRGKEYAEGRRSLEAACAHRRQDAETLCALAESWGREDPSKARDLFHRAVAVDATEPMTLSRYIEFEIAQLSDGAVVRLAAPMIRDAMGRCRKQIEARVNLPWAWASLGVLNLLVEAPYEALGALAQLIRLCEPPRDASAGGGVWPAAAAFGRRPRPAAHARRSRPHSVHPREPAGLRLVPSGRSAGPGRRCERRRGGRRAPRVGFLGAGVSPASGSRPLLRGGAAAAPQNESIVILSGGGTPEAQSAMDAFKPVWLRARQGLSFTLFCGGRAGRDRRFGGLGPHSARAAARLDRYCGRRRGPASSEAP